MLKCWVCSEHNFYIEIRETFNVNRIDKPISALRSRCLNTSVEIYIYIVNICTWSLFMLDMYQIN